MSYMARIDAANFVDLSGYRPFVVDGEAVGRIAPGFWAQLQRWPEVFHLHANCICLAPELEAAGAVARTDAVDKVVCQLREDGVISGWRDEQYAVGLGWGRPAAMTMERAAVPFFGVTGYGVHINGWCRTTTGLHLWVARRSPNKPTDPGKFDQLVAGGQPAALGLMENVIKECAEEAGIDPAMAAQARSVGTVSYALTTTQGFRPDVLFVFDLELPVNFQPENTDGEVDAFYLWPVERVAEVVRTSQDFKFNCALVVIDFLIRHGAISPEDPDYPAIVAGLRRREAYLANYAHG